MCCEHLREGATDWNFYSPQDLYSTNHEDEVIALNDSRQYFPSRIQSQSHQRI